MQVVVGIDIGGTKCAVSFARYGAEGIHILDKIKMPTEIENFQKAVSEFIHVIRTKFSQMTEWRLCSIGISCGGPLDAAKGVILAPPNLPNWNWADIFTPLKQEFEVPVMLQNDADACALAEWNFGAGKGCKNMVFLTFGTGMGAGLILNGELYSGTTNLAGEIGHIRLEKEGPYGYGKKGSFEGFCSGGGIADLGKKKAQQAFLEGKKPSFCENYEQINEITCKKIADALAEGDKIAEEIFDTVAEYLGRGISIIIDLLNPQVIIIGSIFVRQEKYLRNKMEEIIKREALEQSGNACKVLPASLGEMIGDYAAISVGIKAYQDFYKEKK